MSTGALEVVTSRKLAESMINKKGKYLSKKLGDFRKNSIWVFDNIERLRKKYPNMYIAVRHQQIIASGKNASSVILQVRKITNNEDVVVDFIGEKALNFLL